MPFEHGLLKGRRHRPLDLGHKVFDLGGARALVSVVARGNVGAVQPGPVSYGSEGSERRRGRLGGEVAVSNQRKVNAGRELGRVVSSSLLVKGPGVPSGSAQNSLSNSRLKQTARGRPGADALRAHARRSLTAALDATRIERR